MSTWVEGSPETVPPNGDGERQRRHLTEAIQQLKTRILFLAAKFRRGEG
jgi:hypothetical protein